LRRIYVRGCENLTITQITAVKLPQVYKLPKLLRLTLTLQNSFEGQWPLVPDNRLNTYAPFQRLRKTT